MNISILISTWNNARRLRITLDSFCRCNISKDVQWEIVLVNNNCTDDTDDVVAEFKNRLPIVYIKEPRQGLSIARNTGLKAARGEFIIFTDDDVRFAADWIKLHWQAYQRMPKDFMFGGPVESEFEGQKPDEELLRMLTPAIRGMSWGESERILTDDEYLISANWSCPRYAFDLVGGFDVNKGLNPASGKIKVGEETDLMDRLRAKGFKAQYMPAAKIYHFVPSYKCQLNVIGPREEAGAFELTLTQKENFKNDPRWFGAPRWMIKELLQNYLSMISKRLVGQEYYKEFIYYHRLKGKIKALQQMSKA